MVAASGEVSFSFADDLAEVGEGDFVCGVAHGGCAFCDDVRVSVVACGVEEGEEGGELSGVEPVFEGAGEGEGDVV